MNGPMCRKGKSCGATCIDARERCNIELGPLVSPSVKKVATGLGAMFMRQVEAGKAERFPSLPSDLRRQIAALEPMAPRQLDRSPGARSRTAPEVRRELQKNTVDKERESLKNELRKELGLNNKASLETLRSLAQRELSRIEGGDLTKSLSPTELDNKQFKLESLLDRASNVAGPKATGNTRWARVDAKEFDENFKIYKRISGDKSTVDWDESARKGYKLGEGSFGTVLKVGNTAVKRGELGANEAEIIKRVGAAGLGPKLVGAEIATKSKEAYGTDIHPGRIAMTVVKGKELGDNQPDTKINGKSAADVYWKAMSGLHRMGIAHNDAHPHNLMVDDRGNGRWVDLGLARMNPKAALGEAIGSFAKGAGTDRQSGNWQTARWDVTGIPRYNELRRGGMSPREARIQLEKEHPGLGRVVGNLPAVMSTLKSMGLTTNQIGEIMNTEIRSPDSVYKSGSWAKLSDAQAQSLINMLYDGI